MGACARAIADRPAPPIGLLWERSLGDIGVCGAFAEAVGAGSCRSEFCPGPRPPTAPRHPRRCALPDDPPAMSPEPMCHSAVCRHAPVLGHASGVWRPPAECPPLSAPRRPSSRRALATSLKGGGGEVRPTIVASWSTRCPEGGRPNARNNILETMSEMCPARCLEGCPRHSSNTTSGAGCSSHHRARPTRVSAASTGQARSKSSQRAPRATPGRLA